MELIVAAATEEIIIAFLAYQFVTALAALETLGVTGCIIGRALYVGAVKLPDAIRAGARAPGTE